MLLPVAHPSAAGLSASSAATGSALSPEMLCVTHHPSGDEFALGSNDRCIRVYSTATYKLVALLKGAQGEIDQLHYDHAGESATPDIPHSLPCTAHTRLSSPFPLTDCLCVAVDCWVWTTAVGADLGASVAVSAVPSSPQGARRRQLHLIQLGRR